MFRRFFKSKKKEEETPAPTTDALDPDQHERDTGKMVFDILMAQTKSLMKLEFRRTFFANKADYVIMDVELLHDEHEIIRITIIDLDGNTLLDSSIKPWSVARNHPCPRLMTHVHGISREMVESAPTYAEILPQFNAVISGKTVLGFIIDEDENAFKYETYPDVPKHEMKEWVDLYERFQLYFDEDGGGRFKERVDYATGWAVFTRNTLDDCLMTLKILKKIAGEDNECT